MRIVLIISLAIIAITCNSKKKSAQNTTVEIGRRGSDVKTIPLANYNGMVRLDAIGNRAVYISGKNQTDSSLKVWQWDSENKATPTDELVTSAEVNSVSQVALSPDGKWISFVTYDIEDKQVLYIQSFSKPDLFAKIVYDENEKGTIKHLAFSTSKNNPYPLLAIQTRYSTISNSSVNKIEVISFTADQASLTISDPVLFSPKEKELSLSEPSWLSDPAVNQFGILMFEDTPSTRKIVTWTIKTSSNVPSDEFTLKSFPIENGSVKALLSSGGDNVALVKNVSYNGKTDTGTIQLEPFGNRAPDSNGISTKGTVNISEILYVLDTKKNTEEELPSTQYKIAAVKSSFDGLYVFTLGSELISCQNGDLYGNFVLVHDTKTQKNAHIFLVTNDDHSEWSITQDLCNMITSAESASRVASRTEGLELATDSSGGGGPVYKLAFQGVFDGAEKIILAQFGLNPDLTFNKPEINPLP